MSDRQDAVLATYQKNERYLTKDFLGDIKWDEVSKHHIDEKFFPVLVYMRDIEAFTNVYYDQLTRTPTGKDPIIRKFMDRWLVEEATHAELLDRFINEAGMPTSKKWYEEARAKIPKEYKISDTVKPMFTNLFGKRFSAVHMTWGAINELSTLQGYKRLWETAKHPVLEHILRGIAKEESTHIFFYYNIAKLKLEESKFNQKLTRYIIEKFWRPVGSGIKPPEDTEYVLKTLFSADNGLDIIHSTINSSIERLPGFVQSNAITKRIGEVLAA